VSSPAWASVITDISARIRGGRAKEIGNEAIVVFW
jgi:hypothetical protein